MGKNIFKKARRKLRKAKKSIRKEVKKDVKKIGKEVKKDAIAISKSEIGRAVAKEVKKDAKVIAKSKIGRAVSKDAVKLSKTKVGKFVIKTAKQGEKIVEKTVSKEIDLFKSGNPLKIASGIARLTPIGASLSLAEQTRIGKKIKSGIVDNEVIKHTSKAFHKISKKGKRKFKNLDPRKKHLVMQIKSERDRLLHKLPHAHLGFSPKNTFTEVNDETDIDISGHTPESLQELVDTMKNFNNKLDEAMESELQGIVFDDTEETDELRDILNE